MFATRTIIRHSLLWLVLGNLVGLILAVLLLIPSLNLAPFTFGRLIPLHLNFLLYGWCAIPLLALLYQWYLPVNILLQSLSSKIIYVWSCALFFGGYSWLHGHSTGKLFLEWDGIAKYIYIIALSLLWLLLTVAYIFKAKNDKWPNRILKILLLIILGTVPAALLFATRQDVFPPINPDSSGATGASLLLSSLAVVAILLMMPYPLRIPLKKKFSEWPYFGLLILHLIFWYFLNHGNSSNHDFEQILGISSMLIWIPALFIYYSKFKWISSIWLFSLACWGALLIFTAVIMFLPGYLELAKFTSLLVAHVHIAMAGMVSSFMILILSNLLKLNKMSDIFSNKFYFYIWQAGLALHLLSLFLLGLREINQNHFLFSNELSSFLPLLIRVISGALMTLASAKWLFSKINYESKTI